MKKIITLTRILTMALCLTTALHTSLYAPIYDLTKNPDQANQTWDEYKIKGNKSFSVKNNLDRQVYVRIGYEGPIGPVCEYTGFILNPGQTGKVLKSPICRPYIASAGDTSIEPWHVRIEEDRLGDFMWSVDDYNRINYRGKWSTDPDGKSCWDNDMRPRIRRCSIFESCPSYCPKN